MNKESELLSRAKKVGMVLSSTPEGWKLTIGTILVGECLRLDHVEWLIARAEKKIQSGEVDPNLVK